jgi:hypothetical protein
MSTFYSQILRSWHLKYIGVGQGEVEFTLLFIFTGFGGIFDQQKRESYLEADEISV